MPLPPITVHRRAAPLAVVLVLLLSGCTTADDPSPGASSNSSDSSESETASKTVVLNPHPESPTVLGAGGESSSVAASRAFFASSPVAVVLAAPGSTGSPDWPPPAIGPATTAAAGLGVPLLVVDSTGNEAEVATELERLGTTSVVLFGTPTAGWEPIVGGLEQVPGPDDAEGFREDLQLTIEPSITETSALIDSIAAMQPGESLLLPVLPSPAPPPAEPADPAVAADPAAPASASESVASANSSGSGTHAAAAEASTSEPGTSSGTDPAGLPAFRRAEVAADAVVLATPDPASAAAVTTARAAGALVRVVAEPDPRADTETIAFLREHRDSALFGVGNAFGDQGTFAEHSAVALDAPELPGGGQTVFPGRRMIALYGHPSGGSLGVLGEQGIDASIQRAKDTAALYAPHSPEPVIPAFEIITTVASAEAGADGNYSTESRIEDLESWVDAAGKAGVYVVLDLQSGGSSFPDQAKLYEDLLKRPHVGLALDAEWRLAPGQRPLDQIGTVDAAEINETSQWLADLTRTNTLPQKLLILHQFNLGMISNRDAIDVSHSELAISLHADGHGTPGEKLDTWNVLRKGLQPQIWMGWKNFYDEDSPTFTPEQTFTNVEPTPWFVSYQ
ncbi:hypothetical protein IWX65_002624 [Arthrobacter sp. CAN_A214]|uniref:hypothetical protein n=1 Tax=Arthrobacter sp. CAN_A214 TaxID=2787720 RepID=UPI0018C8F2AE